MTANAHRLGTQRQRFEHVRAALNAAIHQHVQQVPGRIHDLGKLVEGGA